MFTLILITITFVNVTIQSNNLKLFFQDANFQDWIVSVDGSDTIKTDQFVFCPLQYEEKYQRIIQSRIRKFYTIPPTRLITVSFEMLLSWPIKDQPSEILVTINEKRCALRRQQFYNGSFKCHQNSEELYSLFRVQCDVDLIDEVQSAAILIDLEPYIEEQMFALRNFLIYLPCNENLCDGQLQNNMCIGSDNTCLCSKAQKNYFQTCTLSCNEIPDFQACGDTCSQKNCIECSQKTCTRCNQTFFLEDKQCLSNCPSGMQPLPPKLNQSKICQPLEQNYTGTWTKSFQDFRDLQLPKLEYNPLVESLENRIIYGYGQSTTIFNNQFILGGRQVWRNGQFNFIINNLKNHTLLNLMMIYYMQNRFDKAWLIIKLDKEIIAVENISSDCIKRNNTSQLCNAAKRMTIFVRHNQSSASISMDLYSTNNTGWYGVGDLMVFDGHCQSHQYIEDKTYVQNNSILANECDQCLSVQKLYDIISSQTQCKDKCPTYYQQAKCYQCDKICKTCFQTYNKCTSCILGYNLLEHICLEECPKGFYNRDQKCLKCSDNCATCNLYPELCTDCDFPKVLEDQQCIDNYYSSIHNAQQNLFTFMTFPGIQEIIQICSILGIFQFVFGSLQFILLTMFVDFKQPGIIYDQHKILQLFQFFNRPAEFQTQMNETKIEIFGQNYSYLIQMVSIQNRFQLMGTIPLCLFQLIPPLSFLTFAILNWVILSILQWRNNKLGKSLTTLQNIRFQICRNIFRCIEAMFQFYFVSFFLTFEYANQVMDQDFPDILSIYLSVLLFEIYIFIMWDMIKKLGYYYDLSITNYSLSSITKNSQELIQQIICDYSYVLPTQKLQYKAQIYYPILSMIQKLGFAIFMVFMNQHPLAQLSVIMVWLTIIFAIQLYLHPGRFKFDWINLIVNYFLKLCFISSQLYDYFQDSYYGGFSTLIFITIILAYDVIQFVLNMIFSDGKKIYQFNDFYTIKLTTGEKDGKNIELQKEVEFSKLSLLDDEKVGKVEQKLEEEKDKTIQQIQNFSYDLFDPNVDFLKYNLNEENIQTINQIFKDLIQQREQDENYNFQLPRYEQNGVKETMESGNQKEGNQ